MSSSSTAETSLLLWLLAAVVALLATHLALGWMRLSHREPGLRQNWRAVLVASAVLGTGMCMAIVLSLAAAALTFPLGYRALAAPALWGGAVLACVPMVLWVTLSQRWWALVGSGLLLGALATAVQMGWVVAVGFRPGIVWRPDFVAAAGVLASLGMACGLWVAFSSVSEGSGRRKLWRVGAAALLALSIVAGQELVVYAASLPTQVGSVYVIQIHGAILALACGVLGPLLLGAMAVDLHLRTRQRKRSRSSPSNAFEPSRRRKRRHRVRSL